MDQSGNRVVRNPYTAEPTSKPTNAYGNPSNNDRYNSGGNPYNPYIPGSNANNEVDLFSEELMKTLSQSDTEKEEQFRKLLLKPQPKVLGSMQIFVAFMQLALGTVIMLLDLDENTIIYMTLSRAFFVNFWGIPIFLVAGSLSIVVEVLENPSKHLLKAYLAMNILSSSESLIGLGVSCYDVFTSLSGDLIALMVFSVIINLLEFCVSVSLTHFARLAIELKYGKKVTRNVIRNIDFKDQISRLTELAENAEGLASGLATVVTPDTIEVITSMVGGDPSAFIPED